MKNRFLIFGIFSALVQASEVKIKVQLSPAGSFEALTQNVQGTVKKLGDVYEVEKMSLLGRDLKSGIDLRDEHMQKKYLEIEKFPEIVVHNIQAKNGNFDGEIEIRGARKKISGSYLVEDQKIKAQFTVKMSEFAIPKASYMGVGAKDEIKIEGEFPLSN